MEIDYPFSKFQSYKGDEPATPSEIAHDFARGELWQIKEWAKLKGTGVDIKAAIRRDRLAHFDAMMRAR